MPIEAERPTNNQENQSNKTWNVIKIIGLIIIGIGVLIIVVPILLFIVVCIIPALFGAYEYLVLLSSLSMISSGLISNKKISNIIFFLSFSVFCILLITGNYLHDTQGLDCAAKSLNSFFR